ncbi:MAG: hypothetical protein IT362_00045 [Deltaproteobacteria bacterium]|nr:hypothetical protein [Deltaproteobacteria bacterium]
MKMLLEKIGRFNEQYAIVENEKAVFSVEYAEFHWNEAENAGCFIGNRYGLVNMARDLMLTAAVCESIDAGSHEYTTRFEDGSDEVIILKKKPAHKTDGLIQIDWRETRGNGQSDEVLYLENILEMMNGVIESFHEEEIAPAKIEWDRYNRAAFIIGTAFGLVLLAREFVQFALSASLDESYEVGPLHEDGGRLVLVLKDNSI